MDPYPDSAISLSNSSQNPFKPEISFNVDKNVIAKFATGTEILSAANFGTSAWTITARLHLRFPSGSEEHFFLKTAVDEHGRTMMEGEFNAMTELSKWAPELVPKPHSWGKYAQPNPPTYFFLCQFIPMQQNLMPDPKQLCSKLAKLHKDSLSPTGMYGFHITTCQGRAAQAVDWDANWTSFFTKLLQHVTKLDFVVNGYWDALDMVQQRFISAVIPRLLDALQKDGRSIKPSLIHADLWEGNSGTSLEDGNIYIFDSAAFYAHHEMEIADWRCYYNKISNQVYTRTYWRYNSPSEPKNEWEDRNRLYSVYYNTIYSVNHGGDGTAVRQLSYNDMYYLIDKFAPFPDNSGPERLDQTQMAALSSERDHTA